MSPVVIWSGFQLHPESPPEHLGEHASVHVPSHYGWIWHMRHLWQWSVLWNGRMVNKWTNPTSFSSMYNCQVVFLPLASQLLQAGSGLLAGWFMHWVTLWLSIWKILNHSCCPGYSTGLPEKRVNGAFGYIGLLTLLGTSIHTAIQHI